MKKKKKLNKRKRYDVHSFLELSFCFSLKRNAWYYTTMPTKVLSFFLFLLYVARFPLDTTETCFVECDVVNDTGM